jgi:hypothetical protein
VVATRSGSGRAAFSRDTVTSGCPSALMRSAEQAVGHRLGRAARQHLAIGRGQIQGTAGAAPRKHHFDHEIGGLLEIEHSKPQPAYGDPWHAGGGGSPDRIGAAFTHIACLADG